MAVKTHISSPGSGISAEVVDGVDPKALVVATRPLKYYDNSQLFFTNGDYGINMNQDASAGGTPIKIHDGTDSVLWTGTQIAGGGDVTFDSTNQNHTDGGTKSIYFNRCEVDDVVEFTTGSNIDLSGYQSLTLWVYVDSNWDNGDSFTMYAWDSDLSTIVGSSIKLEDYFNYGNTGVWQKISIDLNDMNIAGTTTIDALRIRCTSISGVKPRFYLDDLEFEETGEILKFELRAEKGTWLYVFEYTFSFADELESTLLNAGLPYLSYDKILGVTLVAGVNYAHREAGEVVFSNTFHNIMELLQIPHAEIASQGSDGINTFLTIRVQHTEPIILRSETDDVLSFTIAEDLSGLLHFRITAGCRVEKR